ncbi:CTQ-dependent lysine 6-oxidase LodA [Aetokthonos hydrillicola Thurmond2011]|jgi:L-lysine 6-oxidase|uniref:CTQ-dependent lysine 6-oxidase LodA n=1 Tax=Aetokthonos hydrillicola Thurmond2011 TaxID=2712845 RepID=A0AAP5I3B0_9CYAN|nr:CTQ-dependent lysine 6-oxidase LodA [Aetokthonos hydrillicola]MBO3457314.1 hypothetical protein [Aetokthonos hydrillicola CCALA 1050]MBW4586662.1 CTQ-dependent lysine 6-oxidase LodA [Aetokthonos hydrillicola CCALA 1050]MDR9894011.1 CTQ-dependent lysine 6-oxidase LodA [Aetokthonos hydrillicola Thurmond2011]
MTYTYSIHPSIGVARVGNHPTDFFLAPESIGGLPIECDSYGNESGKSFTTFKSTDSGFAQIKRQGQKFRLYRYNSEQPNAKGEELYFGHDDVKSIKWTVHLANKKAAWYEFSELKGNLLLGPENSYAAQGVPFRNQQVPDRKKLIIDPGPRHIHGDGKSNSIEISRETIPHPDNYPRNFPYPPTGSHYYGTPIEKLGDLKTDGKGRLIVLGGHGYSWGLTTLTGYGGGDYWYDDISDGSVTCTITVYENGEEKSHTLDAWVIVGPPDFAPEISNISSWDDTMFDVGVRDFKLVPQMYENGNWKYDFKANYQRDILPIIHRISRYHWVANVQSMIAFSSNIFDFSDPSEKNEANRQKYFSYFRKPEDPTPQSRQYTLFVEDQIPLMPLNSGSNSVKNINIEKFLALTPTQYFLLEQWAKGNFTNDCDYTPYPVNEKNRASIGNVVGLPQCPGIEVTWTTQNPVIYSAPYNIKHHDHKNKGLDPERDECEKTDGCQPGDLTKRMAIPWQADFYNCSVQAINFTDQDTNKILAEDGGLIPKPPAYYTYWWPPQAPWNVISSFIVVKNDQEYSGQVTILKDLIKQQLKNLPENSSKTEAELDKLTDEQFEALSDSEMAGKQVDYARGINSYSQMVNFGWSHLGFIRNQNTKENGQKFPYLVETERDHEMFKYKLVDYQDITNNPDDQDGQFVIISLQPVQKRQEIKTGRIQQIQQSKTTLSVELQEKLEKSHRKSQQAVEAFREIPVSKETRERPRSGRRVRF